MDSISLQLQLEPTDNSGVIRFPDALDEHLHQCLRDGLTGIIASCWSQENPDVGERVRLALLHHAERWTLFHFADHSTMAIVASPLTAPAQTEAIATQIANELRESDSPDGESAGEWAIATAVGYRSDTPTTLEKYINHAMQECWLYGGHEVTNFDDVDRSLLA